MRTFNQQGLTRRGFLLGGTGCALVATGVAQWTSPVKAADGEHRLIAAPERVSLVGEPHPDTDVWCYGGRVPGPEIRLRQGERLRAVLENRLDEGTTVHFHGIRLPNEMDGVSNLTQPPVEPGESFIYEFEVLDAGTFWYHPHHRSFEQTGRGMSGALIVEEHEPIQVDRDVTWVLDDWRLDENARITDDFHDMHDVTHAGRIGNTVTVNGRIPEIFAARAGERVRLRLINVANARFFGLELEGHAPKVIALDGHPVEPHEPEDGRIVLGPAMRADVVIDMQGDPGDSFQVSDTFYERFAYRLLDIAYADEPPLRAHPLDAAIRLPDNPLPEPDVEGAERHEIAFEGGMMGGMPELTLEGERMGLRDVMHRGMAWAVNGVVAEGHRLDPVITLARDTSCVINLRNDTAWHHPIHLHGHAFRVISRNGAPTRHREWQDTVLLNPREEAEIAFVADNPGDWLLHCHVQEHMAGGMSSVIRVA